MIASSHRSAITWVLETVTLVATLSTFVFYNIIIKKWCNSCQQTIRAEYVAVLRRARASSSKTECVREREGLRGYDT